MRSLNRISQHGTIKIVFSHCSEMSVLEFKIFINLFFNHRMNIISLIPFSFLSTDLSPYKLKWQWAGQSDSVGCPPARWIDDLREAAGGRWMKSEKIPVLTFSIEFICLKKAHNGVCMKWSVLTSFSFIPR